MSSKALLIRIWLPLSVLLGFSVLLASLSGLQLADFRNHILSGAQSRLGSHGRMLQHHLEEEIRTAGPEAIQDDFTVLASIPEVAAGALISPQGEILASDRMEWRNGTSTQLQDFHREDFQKVQSTNRTVSRWLHDSRVLTYYLPISLPSQDQLRPRVAVLFISYDTSSILNQAWNHALKRFVLLLAIGLGIRALLMVFMHRRLLAPQKKLDSALAAFGEGRLETRMPAARDPELARLANTFNAMADRQQQLLVDLSVSRENLSATLDSIGDAVIVTDADGRITRMNSVAEELTGWTFHAARGRAIEDIMVLVDNHRGAHVAMPVRQVLDAGEVVMLANHTKLIRRDGSEVHIADSAAPIRNQNGEIGGVVMVCRNVSEEYALRESLREQETIYRLMAEQTASFDYWIDTRGQYRYISPSCARITGYNEADFKEHANFLESITHPDDREMLRRHGEEISRPGTPQHSMEFRILTRDGRVRWLHHLCQDVVSEDGKWLGRRSSNLDVTERKASQEALARQTSQLQAQVDERTYQLQAANTALIEASRAKDEFLAAMSHELRTPLTAILGLTELLREQHQGPLNPKQNRSVRQIEDSGRHLLELINDILDVAKIESGKLTLQEGEIRVSTVVESSLAMVREAARAKNLRLSLAEDGRVARLRGDARRIKQALVNLLSNAVKFTPEGGQIGLEVMGDDVVKQARFTVWDTGIGISAEDQARLFHPFSQLDSRLGREYTGTGLGLVLVKSMIELHRGQVLVHSEPGKGSRFSFTLPWDPDEKWVTTHSAQEDTPAAKRKALPSETLPASQPPEPQAEQPAGHSAQHTLTVSDSPPPGHRILLVDDNEVNREMAREFLEIGGHTVRTAEDGQQALAMLQADPLPEMVLLDIQMPVMDGPTTLAALRVDPRTAHLPVVALTALAMSGDKDRLMQQGFNAYLAKPYQIDALLQVVADMLDTPKQA